MTDIHQLPADHALRPLEARMLKMATDMGPLMVAGGNFVAALRVFAGQHPTLHESGDCWEVFDDTDSETGEDYRGIRQRYPARGSTKGAPSE